MTLSHKIKNNVILITLGVKLDGENTLNFESYTDDLLNNQLEGFKGVMIDFKNVRRLSSSGVGIIVSFFKKLKKKNIQLVLCNLSEEVSEPFYIIHLDDVIDIFPNEKEALSIFQDPEERYETFSSSVPQKVLNQLNSLSQKKKKTRSSLVEEALTLYLSSQDKNNQSSE